MNNVTLFSLAGWSAARVNDISFSIASEVDSVSLSILTICVELESLYRAPLGAFLKRELGDKCSNIYIEAPVESRAYREMLKVNEKAKAEGTEFVTLDEMIERVKRKDIFKEKHNASDCYDIADYVVDNSSIVTYDEFLKEIETIAYDTINKTNNSHSKKDSSKKMVLKNE